MNEQGIEESQKAGAGDWVESKKLSIDTEVLHSKVFWATFQLVF